jgi:bifunctional non-homologous end joining protein LigD
MARTKSRSKSSLTEYERKRDFSRTNEPSGGARGAKARRKHPRFAFQKHSATSEHYDLRLEVDGVLASWAIPKGPSLDPRDKRLAMRTEDHPLQYLEWEGVIPEGEYGAGPMIVWDRGVFQNI